MKVQKHCEAVVSAGAAGTQGRLAASNRLARMVLETGWLVEWQREPHDSEHSFAAILSAVCRFFCFSDTFAAAKAEGRVTPRLDAWVGKLIALRNEVWAPLLVDARAAPQPHGTIRMIMKTDPPEGSPCEWTIGCRGPAAWMRYSAEAAPPRWIMACAACCADVEWGFVPNDKRFPPLPVSKWTPRAALVAEIGKCACPVCICEQDALFVCPECREARHSGEPRNLMWGVEKKPRRKRNVRGGW